MASGPSPPSGSRRRRVSSPPSAGSVRTCVGCRERAAKSVLIRVVADDRGAVLELVPDPRGRRPGRGAHLHPTPACLDLALRRRAFPRALRTSVPRDGVATEALAEYVRQHQQHSQTDNVGTDQKLEQQLMSTR